MNKQPKYPKNMRLVDPQSSVWMIGRSEKILSLLGTEPQFTGYQAGNLVTISTELTQNNLLHVTTTLKIKQKKISEIAMCADILRNKNSENKCTHI
jgi:hypothetical protein